MLVYEWYEKRGVISMLDVMCKGRVRDWTGRGYDERQCRSKAVEGGFCEIHGRINDRDDDSPDGDSPGVRRRG